MAHGNDSRRSSEQIEPFGVAPGIEVFDCLAINLPPTLAMLKRRNCRYRAKQHGIITHLREDLHANRIALNPGIEQRLSCVIRLSLNPTRKLLQNRAQLCFMSACHRAEQHSSSNSEEFPPELPGQLEPIGTKWLDLKTCTRQSLRGRSHRRTCIRRHRRTAVILEISNRNFLQLIAVRPAHRNRHSRWIADVWPLYYLKQQLQILHLACHRSHDPDQSKRPDRIRKMPSCRNAPGRRLQTADSAEVRRHSNRSAAVASHSGHRHSRRDRRRLTATRSTRCPAQIPRTIGAAVEKIVGLPRHQQLRRVCRSQNDCSGIAQPRNQRRILGRNCSLPQFGSRFTPESGDFNRALDTNRDSMQCSQLRPPPNGNFSLASLTKRSFGVHLHKGIQYGI